MISGRGKSLVPGFHTVCVMLCHAVLSFVVILDLDRTGKIITSVCCVWEIFVILEDIIIVRNTGNFLK